jgi:hypothetical protein
MKLRMLHDEIQIYMLQKSRKQNINMQIKNCETKIKRGNFLKRETHTQLSSQISKSELIKGLGENIHKFSLCVNIVKINVPFS